MLMLTALLISSTNILIFLLCPVSSGKDEVVAAISFGEKKMKWEDMDNTLFILAQDKCRRAIPQSCQKNDLFGRLFISCNMSWLRESGALQLAYKNTKN